MQIIADLHTHTNVTDHAFSTLTEMVQAAEDRGLAAIAITNHGPTNPDGPHEWHFSNLDLIPRKIGKVTVIRGIEFDITAPAGGINVISNKSLKPVEFALASFHECMFPPVDSSVHTAALEAILAAPGGEDGPTPFFTATFGGALCSAHWGREIYILEPAQDGAAQAALLAEIPEGHASIGEC